MLIIRCVLILNRGLDFITHMYQVVNHYLVKKHFPKHIQW